MPCKQTVVGSIPTVSIMKGRVMKLPIIGDKVKEDGKILEVVRVFKNNANYMVVEYEDRNGLRGCVLPEYWYKKQELDGQAGSEAPS